jgi:hypothetical protein
MSSTGLRRGLPVLALLLSAGCAGLGGLGAPDSRPSERPGWRIYTAGALAFEAPSAWEARGDARKVTLVPPEGSARLEAWVAADRGASATACLAAAEAGLKERDAGLERVQRHPSTLAGKPALVQEADQGSTHGWAYVVCAGPAQHWLTFTGRSPVSQRLLEEWRQAIQTARLGGGT